MRDFSTCRHRPCAGDPDWKGVGPTDRGGRDTPDRSPGQAPGHDREALAREVKFLPEPPAAVADDGVFEGYASLLGPPESGS